MPSKSGRTEIAKDTLRILEQGYFETPSNKKIGISETQRSAEKGTITYSPSMSDILLKEEKVGQNFETEIIISGQTTLDAVRQLVSQGNQDVLCLNFASAKNPGGGFLGGAQAQEESIARATGLYPCLLKAREYYETHRNTKSCFYTDYMIYSPNVPILKDEDGNNLHELVTAAIITSPAVNTGVVKRNEVERVGEIEGVMKRRIEKVLAIALKHGHTTLVLGAWGCGVFQNDPADIARYFKQVIKEKFPYSFRKIVFAIYARDERFIKAFYEEFG